MRADLRQGGRLVAAGAAIALLASCVPAPVFQGDPAAPVLVRGRVVDAAGRGLPGVVLQLTVRDMASSQAGNAIPLFYSAQFSTAPDGSFELHVRPDTGIRAAAAENNAFVNFHIDAISAVGEYIFPFAFPRELTGDAWAGDVPQVVISPSGITQPGTEPGVTTPPG